MTTNEKEQRPDPQPSPARQAPEDSPPTPQDPGMPGDSHQQTTSGAGQTPNQNQ